MNLLRHETSPYLLQHKDNPVHWRPWGDKAFAEAKEANKPILLSVGYAACHWCHVMAHESFESPAIAQVMNQLFVNVKVDREERPDVDAVYMQALALMGEQGGWPLTMFLTPEGKPFWGGTYFPPEARHGRPGFVDLLQGVHAAWTERPGEVEKNVQGLAAALEKLSRPSPGQFNPDWLDSAAQSLLSDVDTRQGGLMGAPKFPQAASFDFLWRAWKRTGNPAYRAAVTNTLDRICRGGIYDHVGGGFARYSTDAMWFAPHFEKMLYDNAQLVELMTLVWQETRDRRLERAVAQTVAWMGREMKAENGALASALDADSEGEEGRFYTWEASEIHRVLGAEAPAFMKAFGADEEGNWEEGRNILHRLEGEADEDAMASALLKLFKAREGRVRPGRDDKALADWNGMAIAALAQAGWVFDRADWVTAAYEIYRAVMESLADGDRLAHSWCAGKKGAPGLLEDYAQMSRAALLLYEITTQEAFLQHAILWAETVEAQFLDKEGGGYFHTARDAHDLVVRTKPLHDGAVPSGNAVMAQVLARLHHLTGEAKWQERALSLLDAFSGVDPRFAPAMTGLLAGYDLLAHPVRVVVAGNPDSPYTDDFVSAMLEISLPNRVFSLLAPGSSLPANHPAFGKGMEGGKPTGYICKGNVCSAPVTDAKTLRDLLASG
jgi:uncharacterized protein YyaL (SSP411 family)